MSEIKENEHGGSMASDIRDLFSVGDPVVITKPNVMTTGMKGTIQSWENGKWEIGFCPNWCGYYLPSEISPENSNSDAAP